MNNFEQKHNSKEKVKCGCHGNTVVIVTLVTQVLPNSQYHYPYPRLKLIQPSEITIVYCHYLTEFFIIFVQPVLYNQLNYGTLLEIFTK